MKTKLFLNPILQSSDFRFVANVLATAFMKKNSGYFTIYPFTLEQAQSSGGIRAVQRFEQCLSFFHTFMRPALEALTAVTLYDDSVQKSATEFGALAVADIIEYIANNEMISNETRNIITHKLKTAKLWMMYPDDILNLTKIEWLYSELDFEGSESYVELSIKMVAHHFKLQMKPTHDWTNILIEYVSKKKIFYKLRENILSEYLRQFKRFKISIFSQIFPFRGRFIHFSTQTDRDFSTWRRCTLLHWPASSSALRKRFQMTTPLHICLLLVK